MELNYVSEFLVLADVLQFQEAADILFISQSSLSKHIKAIEAELGRDLFVRSKRAVALTDFGKAWLPYATQIGNAQRDYTRDLLNSDQDTKMISIGYNPLVTLHTFMPFFSKFREKHPKYQYTFMLGNEKELSEWLELKKVDFILTGSTDFSVHKYQTCRYICDCLCVIMPENHPLARKDAVTLHDIQEESLIEFYHTESLIHAVENADPTFHFRPSIKAEKLSVLLDFVKQGMGLAFLTYHMNKHSPVDGIVCRRLQPDIFYEIKMVYPGKNPSQIAKEFAAYLQEQ